MADRKLAVTVHVANPDTGQREVFVAGTVPPGWAVDLIDNPDVWDDGTSSADEDESAPRKRTVKTRRAKQ